MLPTYFYFGHLVLTDNYFQESSYYKARFDPPKKEQKQRDKLSANIQKFLAKKEEEERQKKIDAQRKRDELSAMRDPKALRKIQKTLKVIKSANKSVIEDAVDRDNTAVTLEGPDQPDQDDYGYESQEAAALYQKMMQKYSKIPDEPKFPVGRKYLQSYVYQSNITIITFYKLILIFFTNFFYRLINYFIILVFVHPVRHAK